jgi:hypothetical protein
MKNCIVVCCSFVLLIVASCSDHKENAGTNNATYTPPPAGITITADSVKITGDPLNNFIFSVTVKANSNTQRYGVYDVVTAWGPNIAKGQFTMPRGGENLKPLLKRGTAPYTCIIGFCYGTDTTFYDYYQAAGNRGSVEMKYIKAYSFK